MDQFVEVAKIKDIPDPGKMLVEVDDRLVVVFHVAGAVYCLEDLCTHDGGTLGDGQLDGYAIACPRHGAKFDIKTGEPLTMPATEATTAHEAKLDGDAVLIRLTD